MRAHKWCTPLLSSWARVGSMSTTGIEPDSAPTARLPEGEPEQCHTCSRCLVRQRKVEEDWVWWWGHHLVFPQTQLSFDYVTYGGWVRHMHTSRT